MRSEAMLLICRIPGKRYIFSIKDEKTLSKMIDLIHTTYKYNYEFNEEEELEIVVAEVKQCLTKKFTVSSLEDFLYERYDYHIEALNDILRKDKEYYEEWGYTKEDFAQLNEEIYYHKISIKKIRSICRLNSISLASGKEPYEDALFHRLPGSIFR